MSTLAPGIVERAYQIARTGRAANIDDIKAILKQEGYFNASGELAGPVLRKALRDLCAAACPRTSRKIQPNR